MSINLTDGMRRNLGRFGLRDSVKSAWSRSLVLLLGIALFTVVPLAPGRGPPGEQEQNGIPGRALQPSVVYDATSKVAFVAWSGLRGESHYQVWLTKGRLTDERWEFSTPIRLARDAVTGHQWAPAVTVLRPGHIFLAWEAEEDRAGDSRSDRGAVWGTSVIWTDDEMSVGASFRISGEDGLTLPSQPSAAAGDDGNVFVAWSEQQAEERVIRIVRGRINNQSWSFQTIFLGSGVQRNPLLLWEPETGVLVSAWIEADAMQHRVVVASFDTDGTLLTRGTADTFGDSRKWGLSARTVEGDRMFLAWSDDRLGRRLGGSGDIFWAVGYRRGLGWSFQPEFPVEKHSPSHAGWQPSVALSPNGAVLAWAVGRMEDSAYGPILNGSHLSFGFLKSADVANSTLESTITPAFPPNGTWWSEPHIVETADLSFLVVWVSSKDRTSSLLVASASLTDDHFSLESPNQM